MTARDERGQAAFLTIGVFITVLLGAAAMAIDVGSWYHTKRQLQAAADAAALAGAQMLPYSPADARALAVQYAGENGASLNPSDVTFTSDLSADDTIQVHLTTAAPGFFSKIFGIGSVNVGATAAARADKVDEALGVAPIAVNWQHPMLSGCNPSPCTDPTEIDLTNLHQPGSGNAAGSFGLINLSPTSNGTVGASTLGNWVTYGFDQYMSTGKYYAVPSTMFNSSSVVTALNVSIGHVLFFPVYNSITNPGSNAQYNIIGWVGFYVTGFDASGNPGKVFGHFEPHIFQGIQANAGDPTPSYGVRAVQLVT